MYTRGITILNLDIQMCDTFLLYLLIMVDLLLQIYEGKTNL